MKNLILVVIISISFEKVNAQSKNNTNFESSGHKISLTTNLNKTNLKQDLKEVKLFPEYKSLVLKTEKLPLFCELEFQLSKLINKNVKFGVEPKGGILD